MADEESAPASGGKFTFFRFDFCLFCLDIIYKIFIHIIQNISIFLASTRQSTAKSGGSRSSTAKSTASAKSESGTTYFEL